MLNRSILDLEPKSKAMMEIHASEIISDMISNPSGPSISWSMLCCKQKEKGKKKTCVCVLWPHSERK